MLKLWCNRETKLFNIERKMYINYLSKYMSDKIYIRYIIYKNNTEYSLEDIYNECLDTEVLCNKEIEELYLKVNKELFKKYKLKIINNKNKSIPIRLSKFNNERCD